VLELADVPAYLLERHLLESRDVVEGELRVTDSSRLNRVFIVTARGRPTLVVKAGPRVRREAAILDRLHRASGLSAFLPPVVFADSALDLLVLESPPEARDLTRQHAHGRFSRALAREAGRGLAALHATPKAVLEGIRPAGDQGSALRVHMPHAEAVHDLSPAAIELTRVIQALDDLCAALDALAASSRDEAVIHGDIRWDNLLAFRPRTAKRWRSVQFIDWELSGPGDPAVDLGAFLGEYLRGWAQSVPAAGLVHPGRELAAVGVPLQRLRPALRAFWEAYARSSGGGADELARTFRRAVDLAAVRLLTAALEEAQTLDRLRARVLVLVPLSRNLLCRSGDASARLLGLGSALEET
jgi:aminoglycoside phosphotransferase (APT) family kinase protein